MSNYNDLTALVRQLDTGNGDRYDDFQDFIDDNTGAVEALEDWIYKHWPKVAPWYSEDEEEGDE